MSDNSEPKKEKELTHLEKKYGVEPEITKEELERQRFNWL